MNNLIIEPQTYKEQDREFTLKALKAVRHTIIVMNEIYRDFWNRDPHQIVQTMNANIDLYLSRFHGNTMLGIALNERAEAAGITERMQIFMPTGYSYDGTAFTYTAPEPKVVIEPEVITEPEVIIEPEPQQEL